MSTVTAAVTNKAKKRNQTAKNNNNILSKLRESLSSIKWRKRDIEIDRNDRPVAPNHENRLPFPLNSPPPSVVRTNDSHLYKINNSNASGSSDSNVIDHRRVPTGVEPPSPDDDNDNDSNNEPEYFKNARLTPIFRTSAASNMSSGSSSSEVEQIVETPENQYQRKRAVEDDEDLGSIHSAFSNIQPVAVAYAAAVPTPSDSSVRNQTFYFGTPLPPQKHEPYHYHTADNEYADSTINDINTDASLYGHTPPPRRVTHNDNIGDSGSRSEKVLNITQNRSSGASILSALSSGRRTAKSWRKLRLSNIRKASSNNMPDIATKEFCPDCNEYVQTIIKHRNGPMVWLMAIGLTLCTVVFFWVPFYVKHFKDVAHYCPVCSKKIGMLHRL